jgi:membrane-associated phospholipid phosphatase
MTSPIQPTKTKTASENSLSLGKRSLFIILIWCIQLIYIPTSERLVGGIEPKLPIDIFPLWPIWVLPYVLCYPLWAFSFIWAVLKMHDRMFRSFALAFLVTCSISVAVFMLYPTYVRQFEIPGGDIYSTLLRFFHESAGRYNALPSGHIYISALLAFFYSLWYPRAKLLWMLILVVVSFSTLFTAQHYVLDILAGLLVAAIGYSVGLNWAGFSPQPISSANREPDLPRLP